MSQLIPFRDPLKNVIRDIEAGDLYARKLLSLWDEHLHEKLRAANPQAAARFRTLIFETAAATDRAGMRLKNIQGGKA
ncbi:hypothetical protein BB778_24020 [Pluralibacter gergoviae]|uniref:hypothetical protein n=1 Tax=Pluralibacter gergoviae TaxID=61647 RepID=UPI0008DC0C4C|nr:hypothetical protein [Pluralibacter gergoviae]OHY62425.1 hypothetical protein BB778_24020 [Pluralibacter gergoviae]